MIAIVDADVRIDVPEQHAVDAAVTALQVVEVTLHGVAARDRIVEIAILDHRERVHEIALRPLQPRIAIQRVVVTEPHQVLVPPLAQAADPVFGVRVDVDVQWPMPANGQPGGEPGSGRYGPVSACENLKWVIGRIMAGIIARRSNGQAHRPHRDGRRHGIAATRPLRPHSWDARLRADSRRRESCGGARATQCLR